MLFLQNTTVIPAINQQLVRGVNIRRNDNGEWGNEHVRVDVLTELERERIEG
jgi:hypothetical protein